MFLHGLVFVERHSASVSGAGTVFEKLNLSGRNCEYLETETYRL